MKIFGGKYHHIEFMVEIRKLKSDSASAYEVILFSPQTAKMMSLQEIGRKIKSYKLILRRKYE